MLIYLLDNNQRYKELVDKYSKNFIDLSNDNNPNVEPEDILNKEKNYKLMLKQNNVFDVSNSKFFKISPGDNSYFECLGMDEPKISQCESQMLAKLNAVSKHIVAEIPEEYNVDDLLVKIDVKVR